MVYQITISGLDGTEPSGKPSMKRENRLPDIGFWRSTPSHGKGWSKSESPKDVCTNAMKPGRAVTLGRVRKREGWNNQQGFTHNTVTRGALNAGVKQCKVIEKPSLLQADAVGHNRQLSPQSRSLWPTATRES